MKDYRDYPPETIMDLIDRNSVEAFWAFAIFLVFCLIVIGLGYTAWIEYLKTAYRRPSHPIADKCRKVDSTEPQRTILTGNDIWDILDE